jgi:hypothetical protein
MRKGYHQLLLPQAIHTQEDSLTLVLVYDFAQHCEGLVTVRELKDGVTVCVIQDHLINR